MKLQHAQKGVTIVSIAFYLGLLALVVYTALKLFPVYMESYAIKSSVEGLESDTGQEYMGALSVRDAVLKRFSINNITLVTKDDVTVSRDDQMYVINVDYEVRIPYMFNIDLVLMFENSAEVPAR